MNDFYVAHTFHPVGQGLFVSGQLAKNPLNSPTFSWVYDCGTSSIRSLITWEVDRLVEHTEPFQQTARPSLDLVTLSHFDQDHINGLTTLLSKFTIKVLLLPYIPLAQRLLLAFSAGVDSQSAVIELYLDPVQFIRTIEGADGIGQFIMVPPSSEAPGTEGGGEPLGEGGGDATYELGRDQSVEPEPASQTNVKWLKQNGRITYGAVWEFVPYNDHKVTRRDAPNFEKAVVEQAENLKLASDEPQRKAALAELRKLYDKEFGKSSAQRNVISLFLYGGPIGKVRISDHWPHCEFCWHWDHHPHHRRMRHSQSNRCGILLTGDGSLDTPARLDALVNYLTPNDRLAKVSSFQVMHHGSAGSWHSGVAAAISPDHSVFCSNPADKRYRHPHRDVVQDFICYGPQQVDCRRGFSTHYRVWKT